MTTRQPLCVLPDVQQASCCDPSVLPPPAPVVPSNQPGLSTIRYRIGTFTSFRRAMLDDVARAGLLGNAANPFGKWHEGADGDYQTMFIELWAYLADILTFYQERIANEAFLPTAVRRDSLLRLAGLVDYRPGPGSAASTLVALTVERGKLAVLQAGFRVGSRAAPGKLASTFETSAAINAAGDYGAIPISPVGPTNQFAALNDLGWLFGQIDLLPRDLGRLAFNVYGSAGATLAKTLSLEPSALPAQRSVATDVSAVQTRRSLAAEFATRPSMVSNVLGPLTEARFIYRPFQDSTTRTVVLQGVSTRLAVGDYVLVVEHEGNDGGTEKTTAQQVTTAYPDKTANTTSITWTETAGTTYDNVHLYAMRKPAGAFGNSAPVWSSLPATLIGTVNGTPGPYINQDWDDIKNQNAYAYLPNPDDSPTYIYLDGIYDEARGTAQNPGWAVVMADGVPSQVFHIIDARSVSKAAYVISSKVTRLTRSSGDSPLASNTFPLRTTVVLVGSERLALQNNLPLPEPLTGASLILAGLYPGLTAGQTVIVRGNVFDQNTVPQSQVEGAESAILAGAPVVDVANNLTTVSLQKPLTQSYARAGATLLANVVEVTQGETVRNEVLGSASGAAFQSYPLKQKPLTYVPSTDAEGISAVQSTLSLTVNGVGWTEQPTLLESAPNAQVYTTLLDDSGQTTVVFGDGVNGARPPTGVGNVRARYRKGMGAAGNVAAGRLTQLIDSAPGLQKASNPLPAIGGADQESAAQIRENAPSSVRTFGRAVSAADYAALALSFPGVAKASAAWILRDAITLKALPQPYVQLTVATADEVPLAQQTRFARNLRAFLDGRRDPNVPLRIIDFTRVYIDVAMTVDVRDAYPRQATLNAIVAALNPGRNPDGSAGYFAPERLSFGQSIHLSAVYAAAQGVAGVSDVTITTLRRPDIDADTATVRQDIFIRPTELARVANDPADAGHRNSKLTVTLGKGGYVDT